MGAKELTVEFPEPEENDFRGALRFKLHKPKRKTKKFKPRKSR